MWIPRVQGDYSGCVKPLVDIKTNFAFQYMLIIVKHNFGFEVNGRFETTGMVTLYFFLSDVLSAASTLETAGRKAPCRLPRQGPNSIGKFWFEF